MVIGCLLRLGLAWWGVHSRGLRTACVVRASWSKFYLHVVPAEVSNAPLCRLTIPLDTPSSEVSLLQAPKPLMMDDSCYGKYFDFPTLHPAHQGMPYRCVNIELKYVGSICHVLVYSTFLLCRPWSHSGFDLSMCVNLSEAYDVYVALCVSQVQTRWSVPSCSCVHNQCLKKPVLHAVSSHLSGQGHYKNNVFVDTSCDIHAQLWDIILNSEISLQNAVIRDVYFTYGLQWIAAFRSIYGPWLVNTPSLPNIPVDCIVQFGKPMFNQSLGAWIKKLSFHAWCMHT